MSVRHIACESCGSSDGNALYPDGHTYCFVCETTVRSHDSTESIKKITKNSNVIAGLPTEFHELSDRGISAETAKRYGVTVVPGSHYVYPHFTLDNVHASNKVRTLPKSFFVEGDFNQTGLYGRQAFPPGGKAITVTEGQDDAMAVFEMFGRRYPAVSVHSSSSAVKDCAFDFEYLNSFESIYVCFDKDEAKVRPDGTIHYPGQEAAIAVAGMFPIGKVHVVTLRDHKDANEYLLNKKSDQFRDEWYKAPVYTPSGLKLGKDMWDEVSTQKSHETTPYPWEGLNKQTYGIRLSEFVVVTAETGVGKTSVLKEIEYSLLGKTKRGVGLLHLEEPNSDTALGLMSIAADKPLHLPDVRETVTDDELKKYFNAVIHTERLVIWDHFGSNSVQEVLNKIRHMHNLGCKYIILDHLSIIVSDQNGDERKQLDEISTKIKTLCMELNIAVLAVIHQNRSGQIRGTAGVEQLANIVLKLSRDKTDSDPWRRNVTKVVVEKNRFCGRTGPGCYLFYDEFTGRLKELTDDEIKAYEAGTSAGPREELPWA